jgi:serine/tyrosine/threonine adenylyltransferase
MPSSPDFDNSYARLPASFHRRQDPVPVARPDFIMVNHRLAEALGLDPNWLGSEEGLATMAGNAVPAGAEPVAMAYGGHQFAQWVPQLGDGRALLLGEIIDRNGTRRDLHLKGSGPTPFSRGGDGRSSIGPVVREYLGSEAMHALGIPTTRALAAVATGETVMRERPEPGGILCRVAGSHVRIGTFEYFARNDRPDDLKTLTDYVIARHYPDLTEKANPYVDLLDAVLTRTASLVAQWMGVGFIHGVMNTDNQSIIAETIDFGPFGWMDTFRPNTAYSYIDRRGRYAWNQQAAIANWNLARLAECLLPLIDQDQTNALAQASEIIDRFPACFENNLHAVLNAKLGLAEQRDGDRELALALLEHMHANEADMTLTFRRLSDLDANNPSGDQAVSSLFRTPDAFDNWAQSWRKRLAAEARDDRVRRAAMRAINPAFVLRNHLAQRAVDAAIERLDFEPMRRLHRVLEEPFEDQPEHADLSLPPEIHERVEHTFCGT